MTDRFEDELRRALRPVEPPAGFAERVIGALPARDASPANNTTTTSAAAAPEASRRLRKLWLPAALAASLVASVLLGQQAAKVRDERAAEAGRIASQQLMEALRVTSQKLDMAYQAVNPPPPPPAETEENRT